MRKKIVYIVDHIEEFVLSIFFIIMLLSVIVQISARVFFSRPPVFTEELSRSCYVWVCFLGMSVATKHGLHIKIDLLENILKKRAKLILDLVINILSIGLYIFIAIIGVKYSWIIRIQITPAMEIPRIFITASLPIGATASVLRLFQIIKQEVRELKAYKK